MQSLVLDQLLEDGIAGVLDAIASMVGENDAIFSQDRAVTYMEVTDSSLQIARQLQFRYGVRSGDRIIVDCHSHRPAEICGMLGCIRYIFVPKIRLINHSH
jgi:acyl-coenzyme A synthetase/AMP-(fatty) acid ligase